MLPLPLQVWVAGGPTDRQEGIIQLDIDFGRNLS